MSTQNISVDTVGTAMIALTGFSEGDQSGLNNIELKVSGSGMSSYKYKAVNDQNDCYQSSGYISSSDMNPVNVDVSSLAEGPSYICSVGVLSSGYTKDYSLASSFAWKRYTACGNVHGDGSSSFPYQIRTEDDLKSINNDKNCLRSYYILNNDVTLTETNWTPIGLDKNNMPFNGYFDGNNFTISGLSMNSNKEASGFFGTTKQANIENLTIEGSITTSAKYSGGLVGYMEESIIFNCKSNVTVNASEDYAGGLVGRSLKGQIMNSSAKGDVFGKSNVGGLVGLTMSMSQLENSMLVDRFLPRQHQSTLMLEGSSAQFSGTNIKTLSATGNIYSAGGGVGGLVGHVTSNASISESFSTGNVEAPLEKVGGFVGYANGNSQINAVIFDSYSIGNVISDSGEAGAFIGKTSQSHIKRSYAFGYCLHKIEKDKITGPASFAYNVGWDGNPSNIIGSYSINYEQDPFQLNKQKIIQIAIQIPLKYSNIQLLNLIKAVTSLALILYRQYIDPKVGRPVLTNNPESEAYTLLSSDSDFYDIRNNLSDIRIK